MVERPIKKEEKEEFDPLFIMGIFWLSFGVIVLFATFFITDMPLVPKFESIVTNVSAGMILLIAGILCLLKARNKKKRRRNDF